MERGPAAHIARIQRAREDLAKAWIVDLVERTPLEEIDGIELGWLAREAPPLIADILRALTDPEVAGEVGFDAPERRRAAALRNLRADPSAPAELPRDIAALQALLIDALRREIPERETGNFAQAVERLASLFGEIQAAVSEELARERSGHAARDEVTGLPGPAELHEWLRMLLAGERRYGDPFSLLMIDIDGLERINDAYGKQAGDRMLAAVAAVVSRQIRVVDRAFRRSEDELCVLVAHKGPVESLAMARRLVELVDSAQGLEGPRLGIVVGVASCPEHGRTEEDLVAAGEEAVYGVKAAGERIGVASGDPSLMQDQ